MDTHAHPESARPAPARRPVEPEHPMVLEGGVVEGDTRLMLRILVEELLRAGIKPDDLVRLSRNPEYQALFAARQCLGDDAADQEIRETMARVGAGRAEVWESGARATAATLTVSARPSGEGG